MSRIEDENLDDVIASLIDFEDEADTDAAPTHAPAALTGQPVRLTERAAKQVRKIIAEEETDASLFLRVAVDGGGCSGLNYRLGLDHRADEDYIFESFGMEVIVAPKHLPYLEGMLIDYPDGLDARGFTFENPNATESCGCGSSFAI